jgi:hypothetical protein
MKTSQRRLILASLVTLAIASGSYCLDWQTRDAYRVGDHLFEPHVFGAPPFVPSPILMKFGEALRKPTLDELLGPPPTSGRSAGYWFSPEEVGARYVTLSGLYSRGSMTPSEAAIGGLLVPFLLVVAAGYLALGAPRVGHGGSGTAPASAVVEGLPPAVTSPNSPLPLPAWAAGAGRANAGEFLFGLAIVASVINPVFFVLDVPSVMLLGRLRFPRWFFGLLVLRALANALRAGTGRGSAL